MDRTLPTRYWISRIDSILEIWGIPNYNLVAIEWLGSNASADSYAAIRSLLPKRVRGL